MPSPPPKSQAPGVILFWTTYALAPIYVGIRVCLANRLPITDCDETFNYWEVVYYLLYGQAGSGGGGTGGGGNGGINNSTATPTTDDSFASFPGYQTWEYSNEFALRTYAYLLPLVALGRCYDTILRTNSLLSSMNVIWTLLAPQQDVSSVKVGVFVLLRATLGSWMAIGEVSFCRALSSLTLRSDQPPQRKDEPRQRYCLTTTMTTGIITAILMLTSTGMGHSAAALLPSSTIMGIWMYAATAFIECRDVEFCFLAIVATLAVGWPFGVVVFVPLGFGILIRTYYCTGWISLCKLIGIIFVLTAIVQLTVMTIDYQHYDRVVSPLWNILMYNTREGLDELYGVEPWTYYVKNLLLNFNYIAPVGIFGPLLVGMMICCIPTVRVFVTVPCAMTMIVLLLPMYLWLGIVMPRPHKEERFLFPIYPCICLGAALSSVVFVQISLATLRSILERKNENGTQNYNRFLNQPISLKSLLGLLCALWIPSVIVSQTRLMALSSYYTAPLVVYSKISGILSIVRSQAVNDNDNIMICTCGEWYRFPSSFYLPNSSNFSFAPSSFDGQLPQPFTVHGSGILSPTTFNDQNRPEPGSLINDISQCDFMVDISTSADCRASSTKNDIGKQSKWDALAESPFLDADQTSNVLHRTLFIPYLHEKAVERGDIKYVDFVLYKRVDED